MTTAVRPRGEQWESRAACRGADPALFYPKYAAHSGPAKAVCARCPVRQACLRHALDNREDWGVWGGLSEDERRPMHGRYPGRREGSPYATRAQEIAADPACRQLLLDDTRSVSAIAALLHTNADAVNRARRLLVEQGTAVAAGQEVGA